MAFKHNSLIVQGEVRAITEVPRSLPPKVPKVTLTAEMAALVGNEGMHSLAGGVKMHYAATDLLDPRPWPPSTRQGPPCFAQWLPGGFRWKTQPTTSTRRTLLPGQPRCRRRGQHGRL